MQISDRQHHPACITLAPWTEQNSACARSWPARRRRTLRSPSRAGCARGATRRPASRSCTCPDGSAFHPVQVVAPNTLPNYADEVLKLTAGCAVEATGTIVPSPAKGQPFEMQASAIKVIGWVDDPDTYPIQPKPHTHGVPARGRASAPAHQRDRRGDARAPHAGAGDPPLLPRERLLLGQHADHHVVRRRGRGRAVPRLDARSRQPAAHARGQGRLRAGFLRPRGVPDRVGPAQRRGLLPGADQGLHVRADLPRRELEHQPPPRRVLDDRAGDRLRRPRGQRDARGAAAQVHVRGAAGRARRRTSRSSTSGSRRGSWRSCEGIVALRVRAHGLQRGDRGARAREGEIRVPGASGASTCSRSTSAT